MNPKIACIEIDQSYTKESPVVSVYRHGHSVNIYYIDFRKANRLHDLLVKLGLRVDLWINKDGSTTISHRR